VTTAGDLLERLAETRAPVERAAGNPWAPPAE
jgi:hypothetical protein